VRTLAAELFAEVGAELGEGPVWDEDAGWVAFVDITAGRLWATTGSDRPALLAELDVPLGAALPSAVAGEYLLVTRAGFRVRAADGTVLPLLDVLADRPDLRFNDAKCDPRGRCYAGTLSLREEPAQGTLFRVDDGPSATPVVRGVGLCNGLGWSPDGHWLYFADTMAGRVDRFPYDVDMGAVGAPEPFVRTGGPDGLCVDETGAVWIARWDGGTVERFTPDGVRDTAVQLPVAHVTSCAFFGDRLIITTARGSDADPATPRAGDLFAVDTGTSAPPAVRWRGVEGGDR
jgi:sugar lactone lactonase YvrE